MMKNILILLILLGLSACVVGEFEDNRNRMHEMNRDKDVCDKNPERCISGVSW